MSDWNRVERRRMSEDSQTIQQMAVKQAVIANDVSHMVEWTKSHTVEDDNKHKDNLKKFDSIDSTLEGLKEFRWKSTAIVGAILIGIDIVFKWFHK